MAHVRRFGLQRQDEIVNQVLSAIQTKGLADPGLFVQKIDLLRRTALIVALTPEAYRAASFLDDRILTPQTQGAWLAFDLLDQAAARLTIQAPLHFIFHAGHVGSTLLSRLLEELGTFALREPLVLRQLADASDTLDGPDSLIGPADFNRLLAGQLKLWARPVPGTLGTVVKATSSATRLAPELLDRATGSRALYLNLRPEPYLATILAGENSPLDLRGHGPERARRLSRLLGRDPPPLHQLSPGELAALAWLTERLTQRRLEQAHGARLLALDFEALLSDVPGSVARAARHFGLSVSSEQVKSIGDSPALKTYSKAPEHAYSPALRAEILADSRARNRSEIARGMDLLKKMKSAPAVAEVLADGA